MYLKSLTISNFRKFGTDNNKIEFVSIKDSSNSAGSLNLAPRTTLIVGKNNSGKTTITHALEKIINEKKFTANDFNFNYLKGILEDKKPKQLPFLEFKIEIGIEADSKDLITNIVPFLTLSDVGKSNLEILIRYELHDEEQFSSSLDKIIKLKEDANVKFRKFLDLIDESLSSFKIAFYNAAGDSVSFNIGELIEIKSIKANNIESKKTLSSAFSKIIEYRQNAILGEKEKQALEGKIEQINNTLTKSISEKHTEGINESLAKIESTDRLSVLLSSDISFKRLMNNLVRYEYQEDEHAIPESQYGLGYTNLVTIIAELIDYIEKYPENAFNSKLNLIAIEEPETFMHPQMQELFIKHIEDAIQSLLKGKNKNINSQLIVTTHSSHILNSKIHSGNSFDNINYIYTLKKCSNVVALKDDKIRPDDDKEGNQLGFLKKHIKYKVSELFFSDAAIFVEGVTEDTLLHHYIHSHEILNRYHISIFNIGGAHALVYHKLIKLLKVPVLVVTDIDIARDKAEKDNFVQISDLKGRVTTNKTLISYLKAETLDNLPEYLQESNVRLVFQKIEEGYYPTSFEEAFILANYKNNILNSALKALKPTIYQEVVGQDEKNKEKLLNNSYKLQRKLANNKSDFANTLLYELVVSGVTRGEVPKLPNYMEDGFNWLATELQKESR